MIALSLAGWAVIICAVAGLLTGRIKWYQATGMGAVASAVFMVGAVIGGRTMNATIDAGLTAWYAYLWWTGGGGDDTKKRLREAAKRFTPTRRTAPVSA